MIRAAIVGLGWCGKTLVESAEGSDAIRFVAGATRTVTPEVEAFAKKYGFRLAPDYGGVAGAPNIAAAAAAPRAKVTRAVGFNRRIHPEMVKLRQMIRSGELGTILHIEATMTFPN